MKYILSPELHRHLWVRMTPGAMLAFPILSALVIWIVVAQAEDWAVGLGKLAVLIFSIAVYLWGSLEAATAFKEEMRTKTWDFQRMSSIGPWQLAMGKLFGATSYCWYVGALMIAVLIYCCIHLSFVKPEVSWFSAFSDVYLIIAFLVIAGLLGQMTAFRLAMDNMRSGGSIMGAALVGMLVSYATFTPVRLALFSAEKRLNFFGVKGDVEWWGMTLSLEHLYLFSCLLMLYFLIAAIYRQMRVELQFRNTPVVWGIFNVVMIVYVSGFVATLIDDARECAAMVGCVGFFLTAFFCYSMLLSHSYDLATYKRLTLAVRNGQWLRAAENTPRWIVSGALMIAAFVMTLLIAPVDEDNPHLFTFMFCIMLFMARDGLVLHAVTMRARDARGGTFFLICYYLSVYLILPFFLLTLAGENPFSALADFKDSGPDAAAIIKSMFYPTLTQSWYVVTPWILAQVGAAAFFLRWRLRAAAKG